MTDPVRFFLQCRLVNDGTDETTGIRIALDSTRHGQTVVTISEAPPSVDLRQREVALGALLELGQALAELARRPELLIWHPAASDEVQD